VSATSGDQSPPGIDPIDHAVHRVAIAIETHLTVAMARRNDPAAYPGYTLELGIDPLARHILGELLDAGWTMPQPPDDTPQPDPKETIG